MQNLFLKLLVLSGVIGGSCFVVWQAHEGLMSATGTMDPSQFVALPDDADGAADGAVASSPAPEQTETPTVNETQDTSSSWGHPLNLAVKLPEAEPTLAEAPKQADEESLANAREMPSPQAPPAGNQEELLDDSEFPLFLGDREEKQNPLPPADDEKEPQPTLAMDRSLEPTPADEPADESADAPSPTLLPLADLPESEKSAPELPTSDLTMKSDVATREFLELPDQKIESPESDSKPTLTPIPDGQVEKTAATVKLPEQKELQTAAPNRFGPSTEAEQVPVLPDVASQPDAAGEMPGLTKLPPSHPGPVLLPINPQEPPATNRRPAGDVVTADAQEIEPTPVLQTSDSVPVPDREPKSFNPNDAAPLELPPPQTPAASPAAEDPFAADPFGGSAPQENSEPEPTPRSTPAMAEPAELPTVTPAGGSRSFPAGDPFAPDGDVPGNDPEPTPIRQTAGEFPAAESMPPLPPTGEVLPEIIPNSERTPIPASTIPQEPQTLPDPGSADEVLPLPLEPARPAINENIRGNAELPTSDAGLVPPSLPSQSSPAEPPPIVRQPAPAGGASIPWNASPEAPDARPEQLIGTAEFDATAPRGPQSPELKIEKIAPPEAEVGEPVIYAIIIRNVGGSAARDVVVEDRIPRGTQLEGTIPQAYLNEGKLSWQLGTLEPGEERKIQLKVIPTEAGQIGSVATVSFASTVSASIQVKAPKLTLEMDSPEEVVLGEPMNIRFTLRNLGQSAAKSVFLRTILPEGLKHPGGNDLEYDAGTLAPGAEKLIDLVVMPEKDDILTVTAQVTNDGKKHDETRADVAVIKSRIEITRTGPENRFVGRPADVTLKIANTSSQPLNNITVQEKIAPGVELAGIPGGGFWDPSARLVTWKITELKPGAAREIKLLYVAKEAGEHLGTVVAVDDAGNRSQVQTRLNVKGFSDLSMDLNSDHRTVLTGERITLKMIIKNHGSAPGKNIRTKFILPEGLEFAAARGPVNYDLQDNAVVFETLPTLPPGAEQTYHLAVTAKAPGTAKITLKVEADDYDQPIFQDQAIRVIQ